MSQSERASWPANLLESEDTDTPRGKDAWTGVRHPGLAVALSAGCCYGTRQGARWPGPGRAWFCNGQSEA